MNPLEKCLMQPAHGMAQNEKIVLLAEGLRELTAHHIAACEPYRRIVNGLWSKAANVENVEDIPYIPVSLFKTHSLRSVDDANVRMTLSSSGTTGQMVSKIAVDAETSLLQQKGLANSLAHVLGNKRLPMLIIDTSEVFRDPKMMSARGAGVLGMMRFGHDHAFALTGEMQPDVAAIQGFLAKHGAKPFAIFGFTFMVWTYLQQALAGADIDLSQGTLIHSGGWKKMQDKAIGNVEFRAALQKSFGLTRIYNFYGMVEQLGSIFLEGPQNLLYPPNFSDVVIRCPKTWQPQPDGTPGIIQVISLLPRSYPGHSLLTEDIGVVETVDPVNSAWKGKGLKILGRVPNSELRGCSDVVAQKIG